LCEAVSEFLQLLADRTVVNGASNLGDESTNQGGIDRYVHADFLAGEYLQFRGDFTLLRGIQGESRRHMRLHDAELFVQQGLVGGDDLFEEIEPVAVD
jgi:hypothetical protein